MDIATSTQAPATDDQELAKVLENMNSTLSAAPAADATAPADDAKDKTEAEDSGLQFETTPGPDVASAPADDAVVAEPALAPLAVEPEIDIPAPAISLDPIAPVVDGDLESIKKDALTELRPLVDKLNLSPQDKFDTLLLIIRSTDDKSLVGQAHAAAKTIEDESKRAEALLDVIKEIDYFSSPQQPAA